MHYILQPLSKRSQNVA